MSILLCDACDLNIFSLYLESRFCMDWSLCGMLRSEKKVFPFEKLSYLLVVRERELYVVYNLCPIPLSFCNKICLI